MKKERILIVDDEKDIRDIVRLLLEKDGYAVFEAASGVQAIELLKSGLRFDLIILDIIMPVMNGVECAEHIRTLSACPILFLTAKSSDKDKIEAFGSGGDDYLSKPFSRVELLLRVNALLRRCIKKTESDYINQSISINLSAKAVIKDGIKVHLTDKEYELLAFLYNNSNKAFSIKELYESV